VISIGQRKGLRDGLDRLARNRLLARLVTTQDVALWLCVHPRTVRRWVVHGWLPAPMRLRNFVRWDPAELRRWEMRLKL